VEKISSEFLQRAEKSLSIGNGAKTFSWPQLPLDIPEEILGAGRPYNFLRVGGRSNRTDAFVSTHRVTHTDIHTLIHTKKTRKEEIPGAGRGQ
jgi:hypothetical protein